MPATTKRARTSRPKAEKTPITGRDATQKPSSSSPPRKAVVKTVSRAVSGGTAREAKNKTTPSKMPKSKSPKAKSALVASSGVGRSTRAASKVVTTQSKKRTASAKPSGQAELKARRVRAPKDLATQYGEKAKKRRSPKTSQAEKRTRRDAAARARLKELMTPDDELLARLARAGMIASSLAPEEVDGNHAPKARKAAGSATRRPRKWDSRCGKCGGLSTFKSAAGLCPKCGAIAVRA